ncbi:unnamed protein product [Orchesella dallaii]|uniref:Secreted protein n=1 Tax=Orchesella dallaii TaxID=48710 RepID=A0ABP1RBT7_9HEXA
MSWAFIFIVFCVSSARSSDAPIEDALYNSLYSKLNACFDGKSMSSPNVTNSINLFNRYKRECLGELQIENEEKEPLCYKVCMFNVLEIIDVYPPTETESLYKVKFEAAFTANQLTILYLGEFEHIQDDIPSEESFFNISHETGIVLKALNTRLIECLKFEVQIPGVNDCRQLSSSDRQLVDKLLSCVDAAMVN